MRASKLMNTQLFLVICIFRFTMLSAQEAVSSSVNAEHVAANHKGADLIRMFSGNVVVDKSEHFKTVVIMGGNAEIHGSVDEDVVVMGGTLTMSGNAGGDVVVIGGRSKIMSGVTIQGDLVMIGGESDVDSMVYVKGDKVIIAAWAGKLFENITPYLEKCIFKGRFIALSLPWTMWVFAGYVLLMLICVAIFPATFTKSIDIINHRVLSALLIGILIPVAIGPVIIALSISVIGVPAIPAVLLTLQGAMLIGIFAICAHSGKNFLGLFGIKNALPPVIVALLGCIIFGALMVLPYVGGFVTVVITTVGTGAGVLAMFEFAKSFKAARCSSSGNMSIDNSNNVTDGVNKKVVSRNDATPDSPIESESTNQNVTATHTLTSVVNLDKAGTEQATFLQRLGAALIDVILVMIIFGMITKPFCPDTSSASACHNNLGSLSFILLLIYLTAMWVWKQTSIGMIIFRLRIYRLDNTRLTLSIAIIRAFGLLLSILPLGLGFLWAIWDKDKQTWYDRIAGTTVRRVAGNISIV